MQSIFMSSSLGSMYLRAVALKWLIKTNSKVVPLRNDMMIDMHVYTFKHACNMCTHSNMHITCALTVSSCRPLSSLVWLSAHCRSDTRLKAKWTKVNFTVAIVTDF